MGGGYLFRNEGILNIPEGTTSPLKIYAIFHAVTKNQDSALQAFSDYVYSDVCSLSRIDYQEFNIFKSFKLLNPVNGTKKNVSYKDFVNNSQQTINDIINGLSGKVKIVLKIWMRLKNIENVVS